MLSPNFITERLLLRPTDLTDAVFVCELLNSAGWLRYIGDRGVRTVTDAENYIRDRMLRQLHERGYSNFTAVRRSDGEKVGCCGIYHRPGIALPDLGFAYLDAYTGRGYGYEAGARILRAAHEDFGLTELRAITTPENSASRRLLEKLSFVDAGLETALYEGVDETMQLYTWELPKSF